MIRAFIYMPFYEKGLKNLSLTLDDEIFIENEILNNPAIGVVMQETGGVRKFRIPLQKGKSGGARVIYIDFPKFGKVYFLAIFAKNIKENLSKAEKNQMKNQVKLLEIEAERGVIL